MIQAMMTQEIHTRRNIQKNGHAGDKVTVMKIIHGTDWVLTKFHKKTGPTSNHGTGIEIPTTQTRQWILHQIHGTNHRHRLIQQLAQVQLQQLEVIGPTAQAQSVEDQKLMTKYQQAGAVEISQPSYLRRQWQKPEQRSWHCSKNENKG